MIKNNTSNTIQSEIHDILNTDDFYLNKTDKIHDDPIVFLVNLPTPKIKSDYSDLEFRLKKSMEIFPKNSPGKYKKEYEEYKTLIAHIHNISRLLNEQSQKNQYSNSCYPKLVSEIYIELVKKVESLNEGLSSDFDEYFDAVSDHSINENNDINTEKKISSIDVQPTPHWDLMESEINAIGQLACLLLFHAHMSYMDNIVETLHVTRGEYDFILHMKSLISQDILYYLPKKDKEYILKKSQDILLKSTEIQFNNYSIDTWTNFYKSCMEDTNTKKNMDPLSIIHMIQYWLDSKEKELTIKSELQYKINRNAACIRNNIPKTIKEELYFIENFLPKNDQNSYFISTKNFKKKVHIEKYLAEIYENHQKLFQNNRASENTIFNGEIDTKIGTIDKKSIYIIENHNQTKEMIEQQEKEQLKLYITKLLEKVSSESHKNIMAKHDLLKKIIVENDKNNLKEKMSFYYDKKSLEECFIDIMQSFDESIQEDIFNEDKLIFNLFNQIKYSNDKKTLLLIEQEEIENKKSKDELKNHISQLESNQKQLISHQCQAVENIFDLLQKAIDKGNLKIASSALLSTTGEISDLEEFTSLLDLMREEYRSPKTFDSYEKLRFLMRDITVSLASITLQERLETELESIYHSKKEVESLNKDILLVLEGITLLLEDLDRGDEESIINLIGSILNIPSSNSIPLKVSLSHFIKKNNINLKKSRNSLEKGSLEENKNQDSLLYKSTDVFLKYLYSYSHLINLLPPISRAEETQLEIKKLRKSFHQSIDPLKEELNETYGENNWSLHIKQRDMDGTVKIEEVLKEAEELKIWVQEKNDFQRAKMDKLESLEYVSKQYGEYCKDIFKEMQRTEDEEFIIKKPESYYLTLNTPSSSQKNNILDSYYTINQPLPPDLEEKLQTINYLYQERIKEKRELSEELYMGVQKKHRVNIDQSEYEKNTYSSIELIKKIKQGIIEADKFISSLFQPLGAEAAPVTISITNSQMIEDGYDQHLNYSISEEEKLNPQYLRLSDTENHNILEKSEKESAILQMNHDLQIILTQIKDHMKYIESTYIDNIDISSDIMNDSDLKNKNDLMFFYKKNETIFIGIKKIEIIEKLLLTELHKNMIIAFPHLKNQTSITMQEITKSYPKITTFTLYQVFIEYQKKFDSVNGVSAELTHKRLSIINEFTQEYQKKLQIFGNPEEGNMLLIKFKNHFYKNLNNKKILKSSNIAYFSHGKYALNQNFLNENNTDLFLDKQIFSHLNFQKKLDISAAQKKSHEIDSLVNHAIYSSKDTIRKTIKFREQDDYEYFDYHGDNTLVKICETEEEIQSILDDLNKNDHQIREIGHWLLRFDTKIPIKKIRINRNLMRAEIDTNGIIIHNDDNRYLYGNPICYNEADLSLISCLTEINPSIKKEIRETSYNGGYRIIELPKTQRVVYQLTRSGQYYSYDTYPRLTQFPLLKKLGECINEQKLPSQPPCIVFPENQSEDKFYPISTPGTFYYTSTSVFSSMKENKDLEQSIIDIILDTDVIGINLRIPESCSRIMQRSGHENYYPVESSSDQCRYKLALSSQSRPTIAMNPGAHLTLIDTEPSTVNTNIPIVLYEEGLTDESQIKDINIELDREKSLKTIDIIFEGTSTDVLPGIFKNVKNIHVHCDDKSKNYERKKYLPEKTTKLTIVSGLKKNNHEIIENLSNLSLRDIIIHIDPIKEMPALEIIFKNNGDMLLNKIGDYRYQLSDTTNVNTIMTKIKSKYPKIKIQQITPIDVMGHNEKNWIVKDMTVDYNYYVRLRANIPFEFFHSNSDRIGGNIQLIYYRTHTLSNENFQERTDMFMYIPYKENTQHGAIVHQIGSKNVLRSDIRDIKSEVAIYSDPENKFSFLAINGFLGACDQMDSCTSIIALSNTGDNDIHQATVESAAALSENKKQPIYVPSKNQEVIISSSNGSSRMYLVPSIKSRFIGEQISSDGIGGVGIFLEPLLSGKYYQALIVHSQAINEEPLSSSERILEELNIQDIKIANEENTLIIRTNQGYIKANIDLSSNQKIKSISVTYLSLEIAKAHSISKENYNIDNKNKLKNLLNQMGDSNLKYGITVIQMSRTSKEYLIYNRRQDSCAFFTLDSLHSRNQDQISEYGNIFEVIGTDVIPDPSQYAISTYYNPRFIVNTISVNIPGENKIISIYTNNNRQEELKYTFMQIHEDQSNILLRLSNKSGDMTSIPTIHGIHHLSFLPPEKYQPTTVKLSTNRLLEIESINLIISSSPDVEELFQSIFLETIFLIPQNKDIFIEDDILYCPIQIINPQDNRANKNLMIKMYHFKNLLNTNNTKKIIYSNDNALTVKFIKDKIEKLASDKN